VAAHLNYSWNEILENLKELYNILQPAGTHTGRIANSRVYLEE
jgi:hypothetical protein